jgi:SNF2 family DNA or RNA helicase
MIIFSQFRQLLNIIGDRLIRRFGSCCIAEFWGKSKHIELQRFSSNKDCICLLLGKDGANGLDLSFVTHIFFLDHIMDESVRNQVISRAFRIGAYGSVVVEQLIARGTVEELLLNLASSKRENHLVDQNMSERASSQLRYLLTNIKLIRSAIPTLKKNKSKKVWTNKVRFADVGKPIKDEKDIK